MRNGFVYVLFILPIIFGPVGYRRNAANPGHLYIPLMNAMCLSLVQVPCLSMNGRRATASTIDICSDNTCMSAYTCALYVCAVLF